MLKALFVTLVMLVATVLDEGIHGAADFASLLVYGADCYLAGYLIGWVIFKIPVGAYCLNVLRWRLAGC